MLPSALLLAAFLAAPSAGPLAAEEARPEPWFEEVSARAGIDRPHSKRVFENPYAHIMQGYTALGAAVAAADYDGDGFEDLFFTDSGKGGANLLYRNRGDLTFEEVGRRAGVAGGNDAANACANALWLDFSGDGWLDLFVVRFGRNLLYENRGDGTFRDVSAAAGIGREGRNSITAIAFDYDGDGWLDLFVGHYFAPVDLFDPQTSRFFPESFETADNGGGLTVLRNRGDGTFEDTTREAGFRLSGWTLDLGHADMDLDGDQDLYVAADFGTDRLFRNRGDGTFEDITEETLGLDTKKGMNVDWGDFDNDGLFDVYVTNITDEYMREGNFLWQNLGGGAFADVARETGTHDTGWGWAGKFFDADNDGWLDLYVANGWVSGNSENYVLDIFELIVRPDVDLADARNWPPMGEKTLSGYQRNHFFYNLGGMQFRDDAGRHGLDSELDGRGVAVVDLDRDGRRDLVVTNAGRAPFLFHNVQRTGHRWIAFRLEGRGPDRAAVGARVELTVGGQKRVAFVDGGNGFASQSSQVVHFGLGEATAVEGLRIYWPSGTVQSVDPPALERVHRILERARPAGPLPAVGGASEQQNDAADRE